MPRCVEKTGTWREAAWFAALALGYMFVIGLVTR